VESKEIYVFKMILFFEEKKLLDTTVTTAI
jgi:hypothetical protein